MSHRRCDTGGGSLRTRDIARGDTLTPTLSRKRERERSVPRGRNSTSSRHVVTMQFALGIITHTPIWVWAILAYLIWQGIKAMQPRTTAIWRALIVPVVFIVLGLSRLSFG